MNNIFQFYRHNNKKYELVIYLNKKSRVQLEKKKNHNYGDLNHRLLS